MSLLRRRCLLVLPLVLLLVLTVPIRPTAAESGAHLVALARARLAQSGAATPARIEIAYVANGYALVRAFPLFGMTDPALIILQQQHGVWVAIAGPGTAFPEIFAELPEAFLEPESPFSGTRGQSAIDLLTEPRRTYAGAGFSVQLPADAKVNPATGAERAFGALKVTGPDVHLHEVHGPAYEFFLTPPGTNPGIPLDEHGYDVMAAQIAVRVAEGAPNTQPRDARLFHTAFNDVFQIDWFGGDSTLRYLVVGPTGGGPAMQLFVRVTVFENDPNAFYREAVVALAVQTLLIARE